MQDGLKSKEELLQELAVLRQRNASLERAEAERRQMESILKESEERFQVIFRSVNDGILIADTETHRFLAQNETMFEMLGYTSDELSAIRVRDIHPEADCPRIIQLFDDLVHKRIKVAPDVPVRKKDGSILIADIGATVLTFRDRPCAMGFFRDVTDRKQDEEALRRSEEQFRKIFDTSPLGIVLTRPSFFFEKVNPQFCRMLGYSEAELCAMTFVDITHPDYVMQDIEQVKRVGRGEIPSYETEKRYIHKNGGTIWGKLLVSAIREEDGALRYYLSSVIDVTDQKQAEAERDKLIADIQKAFSKVRRLSGLLPVCSSCKRIRDDSGYWKQLELYIQDNSEAEVSHGICPDCTKRLYPDFYERSLKGRNG
ncbi:MAG: putative diguanylate cyclase YegE [Syntrophaceae bacterium PtaU1.Bin231]|jgi:PAS domain S-box-containing protein|nr:MAG: putative diguanylate cyclase YegE [Syntrophaceae bacterium PtaU1.Bin231]